MDSKKTSSPKRPRVSQVIVTLLAFASFLQAAPPASWQGLGIGSPGANPGALNLQPGQLVGTCFSRLSNNNPTSDPEGFVLAVFDTRDPLSEGAVPGALWRTDSLDPINGPFYRYHGDQMRAKVLGEVFGVCVSRENAPDIWVTGTSAYAADALSWDNGIAPNNTLSAGAQLGRVYRIDNASGNPVDVVSINNLPISGGGRPAELGNICWHRSGDGGEWVYVSNLNDGLIYRLEAQNLQGSQLTFDHGIDARPLEGLVPVPDDPATEVTSRDRVIWGLQVHQNENRLYYSVFNGTSAPCEIWSVELDATTGAFLPATARLDITVPFSPQYRAPIASLQFNADESRLFAAERGHSQLGINGAHNDRILEWEFDSSGPSWNLVPEITPTPTFKYHLGSSFGGQNAAGGVQPDCQGNVWVTGNFYTGTTAGAAIYGAQRIPAGGNFASAPEQSGSTSLWVDYNDSPVEVTKYALGALAMWEPCGCIEFEIANIECPKNSDEPFQVTIDITNLVDQTAFIAWLRPCPDDELPPGATSFTPNPSSLFNLDTPIGNGEQTSITFEVPFDGAGQKICLSLSLFDQKLEECCTEKFCFDLPLCDCAEILDQSVETETLANGDVKHTITLTVHNYTNFSANPYPFSFATIPPQPGFVTFDATPVPDPILPGQSGTVTFCYLCPLINQPCPDKIITTMAFHDGSIENCCSIAVCIELGQGGKVSDPDTCQIINGNVTACLDPDTQSYFADIRVTICNNFCEPRIYDWEVLGLSDNITAISPPDGTTLSLAPGECQTISFRISGILNPGESGEYQITFQPTDGGPALTCTGLFTRPQDPVKIIGVGDEPGPEQLTRGKVARLNYQVINEGPKKVTISVLFTSQFGAFLIGKPGTDPQNFVYATRVTVPAHGKVDLPIAIKLEDPSRTDLPRFVEINAFEIEEPLSPFGNHPQARAIEVPTTRFPRGGERVICINCSLLRSATPETNGLFRLEIEVLRESAKIRVEKSAAIPDWQEASIKLDPDTLEGGVETLTLLQGRHFLYIDHIGAERCFFRIRYQ